MEEVTESAAAASRYNVAMGVSIVLAYICRSETTNSMALAFESGIQCSR